MKILYSIMILAFIFSTNIVSADSIDLPCVSAPGSGIECPPGSQTSTRWIEDAPTLTDQLQDPVIFAFFTIPIALIIIFSFLIYFKNKNEKTLNIERIKLNIWNQLSFLVIVLLGYAIYIVTNNNVIGYDDYRNDYEVIKKISSFTYPIFFILFAHYITLFLREKVHYITTAIILILIAVIGYFSLTSF